MKKALIGLALLMVTSSLQGCLVVSATGAAVGVAGTVVGTGVKATGAVVGAVIPDGDKKDKKTKKTKDED